MSRSGVRSTPSWKCFHRATCHSQNSAVSIRVFSMNCSYENAQNIVTWYYLWAKTSIFILFMLLQEGVLVKKNCWILLNITPMVTHANNFFVKKVMNFEGMFKKWLVLCSLTTNRAVAIISLVVPNWCQMKQVDVSVHHPVICNLQWTWCDSYMQDSYSKIKIS